MSKTKLHSEKAKSKHGVYGDDFEDYPFEVKKYYDRHCGSKDSKVEKMERRERREEREFKRLKNELIDK